IPWAWRLPSRGTLTPLRERSSLPLPVLARKGQESPLEGTLRCPIASGLSAVTSARVSLVAIPAEHRRAPPPTPFPQERGGTSRRPIQHDLAGLAGAHGLEALLKVARGQPMRDHLADIEAALQHRNHLVP